MASGILLPIPRLGHTPVASQKAFLYLPGTTTKITSYSDQALTSANANPVVADSAGLFPNIFIDPAIGVKVVIAPSTDTDPPVAPVYTVDSAYVPASHLDPLICQGRLTLESDVAVSVSDQTAKTSIFFTPYGGNRIGLYDATNSVWRIHSFSERSLALTGFAADTNFDLFIYDNAGTITLEQTAWTNATTRATSLAKQDGVLVKSGSTNKRYLGTFRTTGTIGQCEDSFAKRFVWNYYHRVRRPMRVTEATDSWTYTTATHRQANNSTANQLAFVVGFAEVALEAQVMVGVINTGAGVDITAGIGLDSTSALATGCIVGRSGSFATQSTIGSTLRTYPSIGYHFAAWLEYSAASGTTTWYGDAGSSTTIQSGITGSIEG